MKRLALIVLTLVFLSPGASEAATEKSPFVTTGFGWCMISDRGGIGCSSPAIPSVTDGYAGIRRRGRAFLGDVGNPLTKRPLPMPKRLRNGDRWVKRGVTCRWRQGKLTCRNRSGHGFWLTKRAYRVFGPASISDGSDTQHLSAGR